MGIQFYVHSVYGPKENGREKKKEKKTISNNCPPIVSARGITTFSLFLCTCITLLYANSSVRCIHCNLPVHYISRTPVVTARRCGPVFIDTTDLNCLLLLLSSLYNIRLLVTAGNYLFSSWRFFFSYFSLHFHYIRCN